MNIEEMEEALNDSTLRLEERIKLVPLSDDGFWKSSSEDTFIHVGMFLKKKGLTDDEVIDTLSQLYSATANCYGG